MEITTAWVKSPNQIGGLDHLAVQAPCVNIYGRLLPGITNVTDRARYYSFYPWLIWAFDQRGFTQYNDEFIERFRRADCLFTLIAERHAAISNDDYGDHAGAMVGSNTISLLAKNITANTAITLSDYSLRDGAQVRYFKNKLGGLGQYYLGVLKELNILDGDTSSGIKYTRQIGQEIAKHMDAGVEGKLFLDIVEADSVTASQLEALTSFCPCQLKHNQDEVKILTQLFFVRGDFYDVEALPRRRTLQTILQLASLLSADEKDLTELNFRGCVYSGALPNGEKWPCLESLTLNRTKWSAYVRNELLSIAVQGLFYALLDAYEESGLRFGTGAQVVDWFVGQPESKSALKDIGNRQEFLKLIKSSKTWLPKLSNWTESDHEIQLAENIVKLSRKSKSTENRRIIITSSIRVLIALAQRGEGKEQPYGDLLFEDGYFRYYPINLHSFYFHRKNTWQNLLTEDFLKWILLNWGVDTHFRVALRKLRGQSQSTFRIRPSDSGLEVTGVPPAVHTRPRFIQATRVLKDIGALIKSDSGFWKPSKFATELLELGDDP